MACPKRLQTRTAKAQSAPVSTALHGEELHAIQDVLSRYVRATDERDGDTQAKLFADNGMIRFFGRSGTEEYQLAGEPVIGAERIRRHMKEFFPPRQERTYQHHITTDHLIRVNGAEATMNAQFLVFSSVAAPKPEDGWQAPPERRATSS